MGKEENQTRKEIIDSLMDRSIGKSPNQKFDLKYLIKIVEDNYNLRVDFDQSRFRVRSVNHSYLMITDKGKFILRISSVLRFIEYTLVDLKFEMEAILHLSSNNFPVAYPIERADGEYVAIMESEGQKYYYSMFHFAPGKSLLKLNSDQFYSLGKVLAQIHLQWDQWKPKYSRFHYDAEMMFETHIKTLKKYLGNEFPEILKAIIRFREYARNRLQRFLENYKLNHRFGIIHGDIHPFNIHFIGEKFIIFDFDFIGYGPRILDIAIFLNSNSVPNSKEKFGFDAKDFFLNGYNSVIKLTDLELDVIEPMKVVRWIIIWGLWAHLIGTKSFENDHNKMKKYIIKMYGESISKVSTIIAKDQNINLYF